MSDPTAPSEQGLGGLLYRVLGQRCGTLLRERRLDPLDLVTDRVENRAMPGGAGTLESVDCSCRWMTCKMPSMRPDGGSRFVRWPRAGRPNEIAHELARLSGNAAPAAVVARCALVSDDNAGPARERIIASRSSIASRQVVRSAEPQAAATIWAKLGPKGTPVP